MTHPDPEPRHPGYLYQAAITDYTGPPTLTITQLRPDGTTRTVYSIDLTTTDHATEATHRLELAGYRHLTDWTTTDGIPTTADVEPERTPR